MINCTAAIERMPWGALRVYLEVPWINPAFAPWKNTRTGWSGSSIDIEGYSLLPGALELMYTCLRDGRQHAHGLYYNYDGRRP